MKNRNPTRRELDELLKNKQEEYGRLSREIAGMPDGEERRNKRKEMRKLASEMSDIARKIAGMG